MAWPFSKSGNASVQQGTQNVQQPTQSSKNTTAKVPYTSTAVDPQTGQVLGQWNSRGFTDANGQWHDMSN